MRIWANISSDGNSVYNGYNTLVKNIPHMWYILLTFSSYFYASDFYLNPHILTEKPRSIDESPQ